MQAPEAGQINAMSQSEIEAKNKEHEYRKLKLDESDEPEEFWATGDTEFQREIVMVEQLDKKEMLVNAKPNPLNKKKGNSSCALL